MKRLIAVIILLIAMVAFAGCGEKSNLLPAEEYIDCTIPAGWEQRETQDASLFAMESEDSFPYIAVFIEPVDTFAGEVFTSLEDFKNNKNWVSDAEDLGSESKECEARIIDGEEFFLGEETYHEVDNDKQPIYIREYEKKMGDNYVQIVMETKDKGDLKKFDAFIESVKFKR